MSANGNRTNTQVRSLDRDRVRADLDSLLSAEGVRRFTDKSGITNWPCPIETAKQAYVKFNSDLYTGETLDTQDVDWASVWGKDNEIISPQRHSFEQIAPLSIQDVWEQYKHGGVSKSVLTWTLTILGAGVQAYNPYTYTQMSGDCKYFRRLYHEAIESGNDEQAKRLMVYHPMLNRMGLIDDIIKHINHNTRLIKTMEKDGYSKADIAPIEEELARNKKLAINLMMN